MAFEPESSRSINAIHRLKERARYDIETVDAILSEGHTAHVTFKLPPSDLPDEEFPVILPMIYGHVDDKVYMHGHVSAGLLKTLSEDSVKCCVAVTLNQGLVVSFSPFHNSNNYSSAVLFGHSHLVTDPQEKDKALTLITNHQFRSLKTGVKADRWADSRQTTDAELKTTRVVCFTIETASAKVRTGGPHDEDSDISAHGDTYWVGHLVRKDVFVEAVPAEYNKVKEVPLYIKDMLYP